jgi:hypothetical protein
MEVENVLEKNQTKPFQFQQMTFDAQNDVTSSALASTPLNDTFGSLIQPELTASLYRESFFGFLERTSDLGWQKILWHTPEIQLGLVHNDPIAYLLPNGIFHGFEISFHSRK